MKLLFIYLAVILAIAFYVWINILKEGVIGTQQPDANLSAMANEQAAIQYLINKKNTTGIGSENTTDEDTKQLTSDVVSSGISSIDRYQDQECNTGHHIYCIDGQIECEDIFGSKFNGELHTDTKLAYESGNTFKNTCGSFIDKVNLYDYTTKIGTDITNTKGVYFDLSNCSRDKPWRVGGNNDIPKQGCFVSELDADNAWYLYVNNILNKNAVYSKNDHVYVLSSFLRSSPELLNKGILSILSVIDQTKADSSLSNKSYTTINGQKYYYGTIEVVTGDTYTVSLSNAPKASMNPGPSMNLENIPKTALLKDSLYNEKTNDYYSNLTTGKYKRPVCKSGRFTSCLAKPPFSMKNGKYVPGSDPLTLDASYNKYRSQSQIDLLAKTPFSEAPVNPSGINDTGSLLEYNHFLPRTNEAPFIKCIANNGSNVGDPLCCNQPGTLKDTKYICPQEVPTCVGYSASDNVYGYCN